MVIWWEWCGKQRKDKADKQIRQRWWKWKSRNERRWGQKGRLWVGMVEYTEVGGVDSWEQE